ncbi:SDR family oxidoreductase [Candidatus Omnitrophota bacterium]
MSVFLVTGGAGFIGSNIVRELLKRGETVRVLDNFSTGKRENIKDITDDIELIEGDIRSYHIFRTVIQGVDYVLHQAALPSVPRSVKDPITSNQVNVDGTLHILDMAKVAGVKRVIYASSSSVYGKSEELPKREDMMPNPMSPYAATKMAGEHYCRIFSEIYGLETVCLRYFNVFGPMQDPFSQYSAVIPKFITAIHEGKSPIIYGDGSQSRDFTFVTNVVNANLLACFADGVSGNVFNVACGQRYTLLDLVEAVNAILQKDVKPRFEERRRGDVMHSQADIGKAQSLLGYEPSWSFEDGLRITADWLTQSS